MDNNEIVQQLFKVKLHWINSTELIYHKGIDCIIGDIDCPICLGFDQSSTQTGIAVTDFKGKLLGVIDCINTGLPKDDFIRLFKRWLYNNFSSKTIKYVVCERAEQNAPQQYVKKLSIIRQQYRHTG